MLHPVRMPDRSILVVQHEDDCPPAWFGGWLGEAGMALDVRRPYAGEPLPAHLAGHDGLLVLGGPMGAYDDAEHPWLADTKALIRDAAGSGVPTLGICLGHQLAAVALGGKVVVNPRGQQIGLIEVGWLPEADTDPLARLAGRGRRGVHWNNDIVTELPQGAVPLARTPEGELQAVRFAPTVWGVQPHPEADDHIVGLWAANDVEHPPGVVDGVVAAIAGAREELVASWRPLARAFASVVTRV